MLRSGEEAWQGALDNLCQRFDNLDANTVVECLRKEGGHAGRTAKALRSLSDSASAPPAAGAAKPVNMDAPVRKSPAPAEPAPAEANPPKVTAAVPSPPVKVAEPVQQVVESQTQSPPLDSKLLFIAALQDDVQTLKQLIIAGADLNVRYTGRPNKEQADKIIDATPLHLVVTMGKADVAEVLIQHGADFELKMRRALGSSKPPEEQYSEMTPLHLAAMEGHTNIVEMLLTSGADKGALMQLAEYKGDGKRERAITPLEIAKEMALKGHSRESVISLLSR